MSSHFTIPNFKYGLDARRSELTSLPGTLLQCLDGHINQGAQIEKRKAFVLLGQLPAGCIGLQETTSNGLVTYGSGVAPSMPVGLSGLVNYQRIRHPYFQLDQLAPQYTVHMNPNRVTEPVLASIVHSCAYGGFDFAIANFTAAEDSGSDTFDDYFSGTFYYYKGQVLINCLQGRCDFVSATALKGSSANAYLAALFSYYGTLLVGTNFTFGSGSPTTFSVNVTGPVNSPFTLVVNDTCQEFATSTVTQPAAPITGVGATTIIYFTKAAAGSKTITAFTAPNVVAGAVSGTVNLISGTVNFDTSLYQTCLDLASGINTGTTGYSAQAQNLGANLASLTITAPIAFGAVVNAGNVAITTTNIFVSTVAQINSGAAGGPTNFALAGGVTMTTGQAQVQAMSFNPICPGLGSYQCDLVFNTLTYNLGRGNLTTTRATAVFWLTSGGSGSVDSIVASNGTSLIGSAVNFVTSLAVTAQAVVNAIVTQFNPTVGEYRYTSGGGSPVLRNENTWLAYPTESTNSNGDTIYGVEIVAPIGEQYNGVTVTIGSTTITIGSTTNGPSTSGTTVTTLTMGSQVPAVIDGSFVMALAGKLYMARGSRFNFSASYDCTKWNVQDTGAGFVQNVDQYFGPSSTVAFAPFQGKLAVFSRSNVVIWNYSADPNQYSQFQSLPNIGTMAKLSVQPLGDLDVLFLHDSGVRSLRVREATLNAFVNDIGSAIDDFIQTSLVAGTALSNAAACSIVDPGTGRYWIHLNGTIYVLSYYPSLKIAAWSTYSPSYITSKGSPVSNSHTYNGLTIGRKYYWVQGNATSIKDSGGQQIFPFVAGSYGNVLDNSFIATTTSVTVASPSGPYTSTLYEQTPFTPVKFLIYQGQVYVLDSNNNVYVFGGTNNNTYDGTPTYVTSPWLDVKQPQMDKQAQGIQASMSGAWVLAAGMDPYSGNLEVVKPDTGTATGVEPHDSTFDQGSYGFDRVGTHLQFQAFTPVTWTQAATFSSFTLRYNPGTEV